MIEKDETGIGMEKETVVDLAKTMWRKVEGGSVLEEGETNQNVGGAIALPVTVVVAKWISIRTLLM